MLYCRSCHSFFDESDVNKRKEYHEYWGRPTYESFNQCPECGSENIGDVGDLPKCEICADYCLGKTVRTDNDQYYCKNCYEIQTIK